MTTAPSRHPKPSRARRVRRVGTLALATLGAVTLVGVIVGGAIDIAQFDQTRGGYEPPYDDFTGPTVDWTQGAVSAEGFVSSGIIIDTRVNCTTGMIGFTVFGLDVDFRTLSERAIVVHKPREACLAAGFTPQFG